MWSHFPAPKVLQNPPCFTSRHIEVLRVVLASEQGFCCSFCVVVAVRLGSVVVAAVAALVVIDAVVVVGLTLSDIAIL